MTAPAGLTRLPASPTDEQRHPPEAAVWVVHDGTWRPGRVVCWAGPAVTVRLRMSDRGGTGVDTVMWPELAEQPRTDPDPFVDGNGGL